MSEQKAAAAEAEGGHGGSSGGKPVILYALVILNMLVVLGVGAMLFMKAKQDAEKPKTIDAAANGLASAEHGGHGEAAEHGEHGGAAAEEEDFVGKTIPMETFLVNLSGNRGNKVVKVNMELEVQGDHIADEIDKRKPQIRDIIIILLSSKTYAQVQSSEGKEFLREEIRDTVNSFLTKGKIKRVLFTEFLVN